MRGSDKIKLLNCGEIEAYLVTKNCNRYRTKIEAMPSIRGISLSNMVLAPNEPIITVTTQSKLLS